MAYEQPVWQQGSSGYAAVEDRKVMGYLGGFAAETPTAMLVTQRAAGANLSVDIAAGTVMVPQGDGTGDTKRGWVCTNTATVNLVGTSAPVTGGQSRNDLVVAQVRDNAVDSGGINDWYLRLVNGTAATTGTQVDPAVPANALKLARITLASGDTTITNAKITDLRSTNTARALAGLSESLVGLNALRFNSANQRPELLVSTTGPALNLGGDGGLKLKVSTDANNQLTAGTDLGAFVGITSVFGDALILNAGHTGAGARNYNVPAVIPSGSNGQMDGSVGFAYPLAVFQACTLTGVSLGISVAGTSGATGYAALYAAASDLKPGTKIGDFTGTFNLVSVGTTTVTGSFSLVPGVLYYVVIWRNATAAGTGPTVSSPTYYPWPYAGRTNHSTSGTFYRDTTSGWSGLTAGPTTFVTGSGASTNVPYPTLTLTA